MKPSKDENQVASKVKATTKYAYVAPGAIGKGRGKGLRSMPNAQGVRTMNKNYLSVEKGHIPSFSSTNELMQYIKTNSSSMSRPSADQGWRTMNKKFLAFEKEHMQADAPISLSFDNVMESTPTFETSMIS
ncbi:hypothetical protein RDI58_000657 [Solanum bulbocastanum]|uniref:Uncharacterized protein n=1 Tax=Solanum bulbocastanum TaxID=147425 RepID=A0AAN8YMI2_SOLBU